jgi:hypothetical protein
MNWTAFKTSTSSSFKHLSERRERPTKGDEVSSRQSRIGDPQPTSRLKPLIGLTGTRSHFQAVCGNPPPGLDQSATNRKSIPPSDADSHQPRLAGECLREERLVGN